MSVFARKNTSLKICQNLQIYKLDANKIHNWISWQIIITRIKLYSWHESMLIQIYTMNKKDCTFTLIIETTLKKWPNKILTCSYLYEAEVIQELLRKTEKSKLYLHFLSRLCFLKLHKSKFGYYIYVERIYIIELRWRIQHIQSSLPYTFLKKFSLWQ